MKSTLPVAGKLFLTLLVLVGLLAGPAMAQQGQGRRGEGVQGERPADVDLNTLEVKGPGKIIFTLETPRRETKGIFTEWKYTKIALSGDNMAATDLEAEIKLASTATERPRMAEMLKSERFFNTEKTPVAKVALHDFKAVEGEANVYTATADITVGENKTTAPAKVTVDAENARHLKGEVTIDRNKLKLGPDEEVASKDPAVPQDRRGGFMMFEKDVKAEFDTTVPEKVEAEAAATATTEQ